MATRSKTPKESPHLVDVTSTETGTGATLSAALLRTPVVPGWLAFDFLPGDVALGQKGAAQTMLSRAGDSPWKRLPRRGDLCLMREFPIHQAGEVVADRTQLFHFELVHMAERMAKDTGLPLQIVLMRAVAFEKEVVDAKGNRFTPGSVPREIHLPLSSKMFVLLPREALEGLAQTALAELSKSTA